MIIIPSRKFIEGELPEIKVGLEGWYGMQAIKRGRVVREYWFPEHNLITDLGLDRIGSAGANSIYRYMHVGLGTANPDGAQVQLSNFLANVTTSQPTTTSGNSGAPDFYAWRRFEWTSGIGDLGNNILTEIGVSGQTGNGLLFSRDLIRDAEGDPSSFPIQDDEQFRGIYELRIYAPQSDNPASVMIGANPHDTITRALDVNSGNWGAVNPGQVGVNFAANTIVGHSQAYSGDLVAITATNPSGSLGSATSVSTQDYNNGDHYRDRTTVWGISTGNGNIRTVTQGFNCCKFQVRYDPVIEKTSDQTLVLNQRVSWARK